MSPKGEEWQYFIVGKKQNQRNYKVRCKACVEAARQRIVDANIFYQTGQMLDEQEERDLTERAYADVREFTSQKTIMLNHLLQCENQPADVKDHARRLKHGSPKDASAGSGSSSAAAAAAAGGTASTSTARTAPYALPSSSAGSSARKPPVKQSGRVPLAAYQAGLQGDRALYTRFATASRTLTESFILPIRSGKAWIVPRGHICRISTPDGPQVGDLNIWNLHNPRERFWASRTRQLHASHVSLFDRLWSTLPYLRPLVTIIADTLAGYSDDVGGRVHDLLGTRCDPYVNRMLSGEDFDFHCHSNLVRAIMPFGLTEADVHDVLNVFQVTGLNKHGQYYMEPCPAKSGDFIEFFAEMDVLCAMSTCPGGDLSAWGWGEGGTNPQDGRPKADMLSCCRPLGVEVYRLSDHTTLMGWSEPFSPRYTGMHGIQMPVFAPEPVQQQTPDAAATVNAVNTLLGSAALR